MFHRLLVCLFALPLLSTGAAAQCSPVEVVEILPDPIAYQWFGYTMALSGDTALLGSPIGSYVHVVERHAGGANAWGRVKVLSVNPNTRFGEGLAIDGDVALVGASREDTTIVDDGAAYVFERDAGGPGNWGQTAVLVQSDPATMDSFGHHVVLRGDTAFVSALRDDTLGHWAGAVYQYERDHGGPGNWGEVRKLFASDGEADDNFGAALAMWGDILMVAAHGDDDGAPNSGAIYVLDRNLGGPNQWGEAKKLKAGGSMGLAGPLGFHMDTLAARGTQGFHVFEQDLGGPGNWGEVIKVYQLSGVAGLGLFGDKIVAGSPLDDDCREWAGSMSVYERDQGGPDTWGLVTELYGSDCARYDTLGHAVAVGKDVALVGSARHAHVGPQAGAVYVFGGLDSTPPVAYCTAGVSASGCQASLSASGTPSATAASGFDLIAQTVEGRKDGIFYYGANGRQANPWGNSSSFQCVVQPVSRGALMTGVGNLGACDGSFVYDLNARWTAVSGQNPGAGAVAGAQLWYHDPANTSNRFTSLSNAIEFIVCP